MKFELDNDDIKLIGLMVDLIRDLPPDFVSDRRYNKMIKLVQKINGQIPDLISEGATRRIRSFSEEKKA